jgi:hypothetical protein
MMTLAVPQLSSRPGAAASLYLDFDGNLEPQWGSHANVVTPAYDIDGNKSSFSAAELTAIREIWARVAEDYAPFNINVTTVAPRVIADHMAAHVAIGGSYSDWYGSAAGGVSYVGGFSSGASNVAFVFANSLAGGNPRYVAEASSHEAGHLFGLEHQATWNAGQLVTEYNAGTASWAPIMGVGYYADRTTWAVGPTTGGPTSRQDDLSIIASSSNGFGYAPDDYGNTIATAATLPITSGSVNLNGIIGRNDDRDVLKFTTSGGSVNFTLGVAQYGPNLDGVLELQNSTGTALVAANPGNSLGGTLATSLAAGTYYLVVHSSGGYGNLGRYTLHGTVASATSTPTPQPPPPAPPPDQGEGEGTVTPPPVATTVRIGDDGDAAYSATGTWQRLTGVGYASDTHWASAGSSAASTWTFTGLTPGQYRLAATWTGSQFNTTDAPFAISSGGKLLATAHVNQQRTASTFSNGGASWQNLGTFTIQGSTLTVRLNSAAAGRVVADAIRLERVYATSGGSLFQQAGVVGSSAGEIVTTPPAPFASQPPQQSSAALLAAAADNYFENLSPTVSGQTDAIDLDPIALSVSDLAQPDETPLPAIDAVLTDAACLQGAGRAGWV